jgi:hypothetical protein
MTRQKLGEGSSVRHNVISAALFVLFFTGGPSADAALVSINFDNLVATPFSAAGFSVIAPARLSNQLAAQGVLFASSSPYVAVVDLSTGTSSPPNAIGGTDFSGLISYSVPITLQFVSPLDSTIPAVTDFVSIKGDTFVTATGTNTLIALDILGNTIASVVQTEPPAVTLSISAPGIHSVIIIGSGSTAFDDLTFNAVTAVPEPATFALAAFGGLALVASKRWRRREIRRVAAEQRVALSS